MYTHISWFRENGKYLLALLAALCVSILYLIISSNEDNRIPLQSINTSNPAMALVEDYGQIPLQFEENHGQYNEAAKFITKGIGYTLFLTQNETVFLFPEEKPDLTPGNSFKKTEKKNMNSMMKVKLVNANESPKLSGINKLQGRSNYLIGNDIKEWHTDIPNYSKVMYSEVYPGVDLIYYGNIRQLEYDFVVAPNADPEKISLVFEGIDSKHIDKDGNLILKKNSREIVFNAPKVYQEIDEETVDITASYSFTDEEYICFELGEYNDEYPLTIDPKLVYATYLGGSGDDYGWDIAVDTSGNAYIVGQTTSSDFPTNNEIPNMPNLTRNVFVTKINPEGNALIYSTYIGGSESDVGHAIDVDIDGNAYITGPTYSSDFPVVNAYDASFEPVQNDGFVAKLNPQGNALIFSTYLGGTYNEFPQAIEIDSSRNIYVAGYTGSVDFPTLNPYQEFPGDYYYSSDTSSHGNIFITKFNPAGNGLVYSTYLGGDWNETCHDIAVDSAGNLYLTGYALSQDFPLVNAYQTEYLSTHEGWSMAIVCKLDSTGSNLLYSTYIGGDGQDIGWDIDINDLGLAYVVGGTASSDFPTLNAFQESPGGSGLLNGAGFITIFGPGGNTIEFSSYLTGTDHSTTCYGVAVSKDYYIYISGVNNASDLPFYDTITPGPQHPGAFLYVLDPPAENVEFAASLVSGWAYEGHEVALDKYGDAYMTGTINEWAKNFRTQNALQPNIGGMADAYVAKIGYIEDGILMTDIIPRPYSVHPDTFWIESTLRPGENWTFTTDFVYSLVSADSGKVKMSIETLSGKKLGDTTMSVKRGASVEKKGFVGPEVTIPDVKPDEIDTLYVKLKLYPENSTNETASDSIDYRIFIHKWTFMVYLDGDNDLELFSIFDFEELSLEPSNDSVAVIMLYDRHPEYEGWWFDLKTYEWAEELGWADTRRIFDHRGLYLEESVGEMNMGDPATLRNFILWSMEKFPAQHYALVLWNHGGGWRKVAPREPMSDLKKIITGNSANMLNKLLLTPKFPAKIPDGRNEGNYYKDVVIDETDKDVLYSSEIRQALTGLPKLDILAFDACLMNMVENAYQYRRFADYMVGSEALEPGDGWPYDAILSRLHDQPFMNAYELSNVIVDEYGYYYPPDAWDITQSAINLWEMDGVAVALNELASILMEKRRWGEITNALKQTKYAWPLKENRDIYHFSQLLSNITSDQEIQSACNNLMNALDRAIIANYFSTAEENSFGLAIFFPMTMSQFDASYDKMDNIKLSDDTLWDEFLKLYLSRGDYVDTFEPNNALSQAYGPIFPNNDYISYFPNAGDKDYYFFTTGMTTDLTIYLTTQGTNWDIALTDFNGTLLGQTNNTADTDTLIFGNLPPNSYYIEVISHGVSLPEIPYKLKVDYQGSNTGKFFLSNDDGNPDDNLFSDKEGDVIGMQFHAPTYPMELEEISYYISSTDGSGSGGDGSFYVWLADYYGMIIDPLLVTPDSASIEKDNESGYWYTVQLSDSALNLQSDFVIGIGYDGTNTPAIGIDSIDNGKAFQWDSEANMWISLDASLFIRAGIKYPQPPDRVRISFPDELAAESRRNIIVPIEISNVPPAGIDTLEMEIFYDPSLLKFNSLDHTNTLTSDWEIEKLAIIPAGRINLSIIGGKSISSAGDLLNVNFFVRNTALKDTVELSFDHAILNSGKFFVETKNTQIIITPATAVEEIPDLPTEFTLKQNYPNPFNPATTIKYSIPNQSKVTIKLYDILAREIITIINKEHSPGYYEINFEEPSLPSGIYFYRMTAGDFVETKKMILIK